MLYDFTAFWCEFPYSLKDQIKVEPSDNGPTDDNNKDKPRLKYQNVPVFAEGGDYLHST